MFEKAPGKPQKNRWKQHQGDGENIDVGIGIVAVWLTREDPKVNLREARIAFWLEL